MIRSGKAWVILVVVLVVLLFAGFIAFRWYIAGHDKAVRMDEGTKKAWSDVDAQLQRRLELIPNLVATVKGYATHEKELFENIAKSREKYFQSKEPADKMQASNQLSGFLSRLLVLQERYPDLKANQGFQDLQIQLEGTENRIAVARTRYNESARTLNSFARSFFGSFFCRKAGIETAEYFEATEQAKTEVPEVAF
ncbi:LemA family protein [Planctomycetota bacterium]